MHKINQMFTEKCNKKINDQRLFMVQCTENVSYKYLHCTNSNNCNCLYFVKLGDNINKFYHFMIQKLVLVSNTNGSLGTSLADSSSSRGISSTN